MEYALDTAGVLHPKAAADWRLSPFHFLIQEKTNHRKTLQGKS
jgi:hypothetical protein